MDKKQFMMLMAGMKSNYPNWKMDLQDRIILEFWYENLKDISYEIAKTGVRKLLAEEEFYPNIAKIRKACASIQRAPATDSTQAWGMVQRAIRRFGYMREDEAIGSLPSDVAQAVRYMGGWQMLCESTNVEADRAHFYRCIDQITEREKRDSLLSLELKEQIHGIRQIAMDPDQRYNNKKENIRLESIGDILHKLV